MIRHPPRSPLFPPRRSPDLFRSKQRANSPQEPTCGRCLARRFRGSNSATCCVAQPRAKGRTRLSGRTLDGSFAGDRKSTRLNSSHLVISYAVFCLKKKTLVFFFIGRKHFFVAMRAAVQFDQMLFAMIDILFAVPAITNRLFEQISKRFCKILQIDT